MSTLSHHSRAANQVWSAEGLARQIHTFDGSQQPRGTIDGEYYLQFSSSDYLGLSTHPRMRAAATTATERYGTGSGGSRLTTGTTMHGALERELAEHFGYEDAVWFGSGYQANLSTIATLAQLAGSELTIFSDALNHASLIDGIRMARHTAGCQVTVFPHANYDALSELTATCPTTFGLIVSDGVFSMSGAVADHARLEEIALSRGMWLLVDDAHGVGALGEHGRGSLDGISRPDVLIGTASKALGCAGGFVLCDEDTATLLRNRARSFVFSTSSPPATVAAARTALEILTQEPEHQQRLHDNIAYLRAGLADQGLPSPGVSPIVPVVIGDEREAMAVSEALKQRQIFCNAIRYPTVARGAAMLRLTVQTTMEHEDIDALLAALAQVRGV
ncbi:8-amino-7-oxononanoate synthase [Corynebacterium sp. 11A]|uniref:aminotransferase class I/II-fold pyridoxal phosphate-dependent enzyme n=1 Tax=Corynebacterium sp. 11A TaxID=2080510 RepID=UPI00124E519C|nr:8-amino-7-oxononanoate synthase [Corynebacterium sp. 11A]